MTVNREQVDLEGAIVFVEITDLHAVLKLRHFNLFESPG